MASICGAVVLIHASLLAGDMSEAQHLLAEEGVETARVRPTTWERVAYLQSLQREDLLRGFLEKQRRIAAIAAPAPPRAANT